MFRSQTQQVDLPSGAPVTFEPQSPTVTGSEKHEKVLKADPDPELQWRQTTWVRGSYLRPLVMMQDEPAETPPLMEGGPAPQNLVEKLPLEMSVRIFSELDTESLCRASQTCRLWHAIIQQSEQLWRGQALLVRVVCQEEVDRDRSDGHSWKVTVVRNYARSRLKTDWLMGRYSHVRSVAELHSRRMTPLDTETWGEILQAELDR